MSIGSRIKELRESYLELSQRAFAARINVAGATVAQFETSVRTPKDIHIAAICREFNVNENWLRTGVGEMFVTLELDDEIATLFADMMKDDNPKKKQFVAGVLRLDDKLIDSLWDFWDKILR